MKRSKLHMAMAMATAIGGSSIGLFASPAGAVNLSQQGVGDALIFPYYTVREGWSTLINLINTSNQVLAVKVKFYESRNSRDVMNFTVLMSPFDRFSGTVLYDEANGAVFRPAGWTSADPAPFPETTCIVAGNGKGVPIYNLATARIAEPATAAIPFTPVAYTGASADSGPGTIDRLREGYVEVIVEGHTNPGGPPGSVSWAVTHNLNPPGSLNPPRDCALAYNAFRRQGILATAQQFGEPINALKGSYSLLNSGRGVQAQGSAVALANFVAVTADDNAPAPARPACTRMFLEPVAGNLSTSQRNFAWNPVVNVAADCPNLIVAQQQFDFNEPSLADAYPSTVFALSDPTPAGLNSYLMRPNFGPGPLALNDRGYGFGFLAVTETLRAGGLVNQWAGVSEGAPGLGSVTEWVITQPTKAFYVDARRSINAAVSPQRFPTQAIAVPPTVINTNYTGEMPIPPFANAFELGQACTDVGIVLFDADEGATSFDPDRSPGDPFGLCYEANVVNFVPTIPSTTVPVGEPVTTVLGSKTRVDLANYVTQSVNNGKIRGNRAGWMRMDLTLEESARPADVANSASLLGNGLPAIGFAITQRTFGFGPADLKMNFAGLVDHSYQGRGVVTNVVPPVSTVNHPPVWP
jgi:hypothetical protein